MRIAATALNGAVAPSICQTSTSTFTNPGFDVRKIRYYYLQATSIHWKQEAFKHPGDRVRHGFDFTLPEQASIHLY